MNKMPMGKDPKTGKMVPKFAMDGKGKMAKGGTVKMRGGGMMAKGMAKGGAEKFLYYGPDDEVTRDHCDKHVGKVMTLEEIEEAWSGDWAGKIDGNPLNVRGGYNCRHHFRGYWE